MLIDNPIIRTSLRFTPGTEVIGASGSFTGSFSGSFEGTLTVFDRIKYSTTSNFLITSQSNETFLEVGNEFNNFEHKQTTTFKNAEVVISGSLEVVDGVLKLESKTELPSTPIRGALVFTEDDNLYIGAF